MAKEKEPELDTITVVMPRDLASMVKMIATHRDITMAEAWERYGRTAITKEYRRVLDELHAKISPVAVGGEGG